LKAAAEKLAADKLAAERAASDKAAKEKAAAEKLAAEKVHECVICFDELQAGHDIEAIPCGHVFHHDCISACIQRHGRQCPLCRHAV